MALGGMILNCWLAAAQTSHLPAGLLYAIGEVESGHDAHAIAWAANGTHSIGMMQVNSSWLPKLRAMGVSEHALFNPCINIQVGAWILAQEVNRYGYTWEAIGAYYAGPYDQRSLRWKLPHYRAYATKVLAAWKRIEREGIEHAVVQAR